MKLRPLVPSFCTILMLTCSQPLLAQQNTRLNGHRIVLDSRGKLLSWVEPQERAYDHIVRLGWDFILNKVPVEPDGLKSYLTYATFDPATLHGTDWPHDPAGLYAMFACARALAGHVRPGDLTHSPWPFRVFAHTNLAREEYSAQMIAAIKLFDELGRLGLDGAGDYSRTRKIAWNWLMQYPMRNNIWSAYFEDIPFDTDLLNWNQYSPLETARYLLQHPEEDPDWRRHSERTFAVDAPATEHYRWVQKEPMQYGRRWGANAISEQTQQDMDKMGSHTGRYASVCALL